MATSTWKISGDYFEACSCDSVCPCPTSGLAARPTQGFCDAGLVFHIERGSYGSTSLDGLSFAVLLHTPGPMISGNWTVGLIVDDKATPQQREALTTIASGQGGGPMAASAPSREWRPSRSGSSGAVCGGRCQSPACSTSPSKASRARARLSPFISTTSPIPPRHVWPSRRPRGATCTPSESIGTIRQARSTATSPRFRGVQAKRRRLRRTFGTTMV